MYYFDPILGLGVDIKSELPFSDFELSGLPDKKMLDIYEDTLNNISAVSMLPKISRNHFVDGAFLGGVLQNPDTKAITALVPYDIDTCTLTNLPLPNRDPLVDIAIPESVKLLMRSKDPRVREEFEKYGMHLNEMIKRKTYSVPPKYVIYYPRSSFATVNTGTSIYQRAIPIWLLEKALFRGTIELAHRRQRSLLHLTVGDEEWLPTESELAQYVQMVIAADSDPLGAVLATRPQVQTNEFRDASGFWKVDELSEYSTNMKLRTLGITEDVIGGQLSVDTSSNAITLFLDSQRQFREQTAKKIFYNKIFMLIAVENDFKVKHERNKVTAAQRQRIIDIYGEELADVYENTRIISADNAVVALDNNEVYKPSDYHMPKIQWHKPLRPEGNSEIMTTLGTLTTQGVPVPLKMWAAAGGISILEIMRSLPEDVITRKQVAAYKKQLPVDPNAAQNQDTSLASSLSSLVLEAKERNGIPKNRDFEYINSLDPNTRSLSRKGKNYYDDRSNKIIAEALQRVNVNENSKVKSQRDVNSKYHHSRKR